MKIFKSSIIFLTLLILKYNLNAQKLKMTINIMENHISMSNSFKYNIEIEDCTKDSVYHYKSSCNYTIEFEYDRIYKIRIYANDTSEYRIYLSNNGIKKNETINLIIPLYNERAKLVKNFIYYSKSKNKYLVDKI